MTPEQATQYEICKTRRHEEEPADPAQNYKIQAQAIFDSRDYIHKTCRWCGTRYREVAEIRQVEVV